MKALTSLIFLTFFLVSFQLQAGNEPELHLDNGLVANIDSDSLTIVNNSGDYLQFHPHLWFSMPNAMNGKDEKQTLYNTMDKFTHYPVSPIVPTSTNEPHTPFNAYNFFGVAICDDAARIFSAMLSENGINSKIRALNGHVATEVFLDGRFVYIDPYTYSYPTIDGEFLSSKDIINLSSDKEFTHYNWSEDKEHLVTKSYSDAFYNIVGDDDWVGTEIPFSSNTNSFYELYPNDYIKVYDSLDFLPYRASNNPLEILKAKYYFNTLEVSRSYISAMKSKRSFKTIETHNQVSTFENEIRLTGKNSQVGMHIESLSPVNGVVLKNSSLNAQGSLLLKIYSDSKELLGEAKIAGDETKIEFSSSKNTAVTYNFTAYIISLGREVSSTSVIEDPVLKIHSQITPTSAGLLRKHF